MPLERVDHVAHDGHGRPVRRVTRYVERRSGVAVPVAVVAPPAEGEPPQIAPAAVEAQPLDSLTESGHPAPPPSGEQNEVDLEATATVRGLRDSLSNLERAQQLVAQDARQSTETAAAETLRLQQQIAHGLAQLDRRIAAIENVLGALESAACAAAEEPVA